MPKVTIIIVLFNGESDIVRCIESIPESTELDILVIDNCSSDFGPIKVKQLSRKIQFIPLDKNYGFGYANNIGFKRVLENDTIDFVILLNQDTIFNKVAFEELVALANNNPEYGIISPMQLTLNNEIDERYEKYIKTNADYINDLIHNKTKKLYPVSFVNAACWILSRKCITTIGGFNTKLFFQRGEDNDYCNRAIYHGFKVGFSPHLSMIHLRTESQVLNFKSFDFRCEMAYWDATLSNINLSAKQFIKFFLLRTVDFFNILLTSINRKNFGQTREILKYLISGQVLPLMKYLKNQRVSRRVGKNYLD